MKGQEDDLLAMCPCNYLFPCLFTSASLGLCGHTVVTFVKITIFSEIGYLVYATQNPEIVSMTAPLPRVLSS